MLVAAVVCTTAEPASAGCGDHVIILGGKDSSARHSDSALDAQTIPMEDATLPAQRPCRGPDCSGSPVREFPPLAPPAVGSASMKNPADCASSPPSEQSPSMRLGFEPVVMFPIDRSISIFHPPRR
jgi:hypothetical protein